MKKLLWLLFCLIATGLIAESFRFPMVNEYKLSLIEKWPFPCFYKTNNMFVQMDSKKNIYLIQFNGTYEVENYGHTNIPYSNFSDNTIIVDDRKNKSFSLFDVRNKSLTSLNDFIPISLSPSQYYQNGIIYGNWVEEQYYFYPRIGNMNTGTYDKLPFWDKSKHGYVLIRDMSPDKMHLLWDSSKTGLSLFDIQKQVLSDSFSPNDLHGSISTAIFFSNSLLYAPYDGPYSAIHDLFGNYYIIEKINGQPGESIIVISKDLTRCIVESRDRNASEYTYKLLDSTPLKDFLNKAGLLYNPTTATLNDDNVRVRENPNLEAKHMGFLKKGETVSVLDRSGLKRTIEPWGEHYWYQIKRESDGLEGWAFGAFLDLKDVQGDIVINAEEIRKRVNQ